MARFASLFALAVGAAFVSGGSSAVQPSNLKPAEQAAVDRLRQIYFAEATFKALNLVDEDHDATGEYGALAEMANKVPLRDDGTFLLTQVRFPFAAELGAVDTNGYVAADGYLFALYLPAAGGSPLHENAGGGFQAGSLDPNLAESHYIVYAWPKRSSAAARRVFAINEQGAVVTCDASFVQHHGLNSPLAGLDAYPILSFGMSTLPVDQSSWLGGDGNTWMALP